MVAADVRVSVNYHIPTLPVSLFPVLSVRIFWFTTTACVTAWAWPEKKIRGKKLYLWQMTNFRTVHVGSLELILQ